VVAVVIVDVVVDVVVVVVWCGVVYECRVSNQSYFDTLLGQSVRAVC
jgi:hypothetical protein